ncbi:MAG TPA: tautomerase family protein [Xanthobacteraceae bacterium]|nr:tautomerase family protein [Xanthobacteraceae bacterium]
MPLVRISLRKGKPAAYRKKIAENIYLALRETFDVPEEDRFVTVHEYEADNFFFSASYLGIARSDDLVIIQITVSNTRSVAQKQALFKRIVERLQKEPGLKPDDIFINLLEVAKENWSFGRGIAQYVTAA